MSTIIELSGDDDLKLQLKSAEFIRIDGIVFVRKDHAVNIHKKVIENQMNNKTISSDDLYEGLRDAFFKKMEPHFNSEDMIHADYISDAFDETITEFS